jgi:predicted metal-binding protein
LTRIESEAFSYSSLQSFVIPRNVEFIDGSAFIDLNLSLISIESGNDIFVIENDFLIDIVHHKLIRNFSESSEVEIGRNIEILASNCFSRCKSLSSITFESNSRLTRIESEAFSFSSLQSIVILQNVQFIDDFAFRSVTLSSISVESGNEIFVIENDFLIGIVHQKLIQCFSESSEIEIGRNIEILGSNCFSRCKSLSSVTFESNSRLTRIESEAFSFSSLQSILIPSTILFIASDAIDIDSQIWLIDGDSCPEFDRWLQLRRSGIAIDFRRIQRVGFGIPCLRDYTVNLSEFDERSVICDSNVSPHQIYHRIEDEFLVCMKSKPLSENVSESEIGNKIENLINLRHPCIPAPIGFVLPIESGSWRELKIVRLHLEGCSLAKVVSANPLWWTSTVKAKAVAGIVLGLRFAHSLGLVHGDLTGHNILFDSDHCIQIVDFQPIELEVGKSESESDCESGTQLGGFSGERWTMERDIEAFASILFELVFGRPPQGEASIPTGIPDFVSGIIISGFSPISRRSYSFTTILKILKQNNFEIEDGVDLAEVSAFVSWIESVE